MTAKAFNLKIDRLSLEDQRAMFYYEYARRSEVVSKLVAEASHDMYEGLWPDYSSESIASHHLTKVIGWLARCDAFPETPFLQLSEKDRRQLSYVPTDCAIDFELFSLDTQDGATRAPGRRLINCEINWNATDKELTESFQRWLAENRPPRFRRANGKNRDQGTIGFGRNKFPFRLGNAINWLRKLEEKGNRTWGTVLGDAEHQVKGKTKEGQRRQWQRDIQKAKRIIAWFEKGSELRASDFEK